MWRVPERGRGDSGRLGIVVQRAERVAGGDPLYQKRPKGVIRFQDADRAMAVVGAERMDLAAQFGTGDARLQDGG